MFVKVVENFRCGHCGTKVEGKGYTNHCPKCLYSKHVDERFPGDRRSSCKRLMEPIRAEVKRDDYIIVHKCTKCGKLSRNKSAKDDNFEIVLTLVAGPGVAPGL